MSSISDPRYQPLAQWTGQLILPSEAQRHRDGGVYLTLENTPETYSHLKGQTVWLNWHSNSIHQIWLNRAVTDIHFDETTRQSMENFSIHPTRLDGWSNVSPLESLAGARPEDDIQVELDVQTVEQVGNTWVLSIGDEPIQIVGVQKALVQFVAPAGDNRYRVRHYHPQTRNFDGGEETIALPDAGFLHPGHQVEQSSIIDIETSPLNAEGWYIYGDHDPEGLFIVGAIEPAAALSLVPTRMLSGREETRQHFVESKWEQIPLHRIERTLVDNNGGILYGNQRSPDLMQKRNRELWYKGDMALVVHTFGWRGGERGDPAVLGLVPGHFAFGFAQVITDEFTGDLRFDLVYRQVYGHNREGVVAGAHRWHSYMGSFKRGWMYTLPVSDVVIRIPELTVPYQLGDRQFDPLQTILQELAFMEARYRTGPGNGASVLTPATSCVKDSSQSLFAAIQRLKTEVITDPKVKQWVENHPTHFEVQRFKSLELLLDQVEKSMLIPLGYVPQNWRGENQEVAAHRRGASFNASTILEALKAWKTMLPRRAEMELMRVLMQYGGTMFDYQSAMIGGTISGLVPNPPTVIL